MADLEVRNVTVEYGRLTAIKNASLFANKGEIIGFIGADGAGKSSLMHAIAGVLRCKGEIVYQNVSYNNPKKAQKIKADIGLMPQGIGLVLYELLSVEEHLNFFADIRNIKKDREFEEYKERLLKMAGLFEFRDRRAGNLSGGMMQKLSLICTLIHRPKLLILDEPTTGVDPLSRLELWKILKEIKEDTISLVSTAYMDEASKMDRVYLFDEGEIIAKGSVDELLESVKRYTYNLTECKEERCFSFNKKTYSLNSLNASYAKPTLEALFFVNALKKGPIPKIKVQKREKREEIPKIVMKAVGLTKRFKDFIANDHIDMILKSGEILGLLGANGAGKSTFIKMLLGLYSIDEGELYLFDKRIKSGEDRKRLKEKIGYVSQRFALYNDMTVRENLLYFANMHSISLSKALEKIEKYSKALGFYKYMDNFPKELPLGINQRFSITAAILHEPVVLFLDEPTSGVDTIARAQFWQMLHQLKKLWGISILVTTHYMSEAEYCDRVVLLKRGKKIADDSVENLYKKHPNAKSFEEIFLSYYKEE